MDGVSNAALVVLGLLVLVGAFGPLIPLLNHGATVGGVPRLAAPSLEFPFGTDALGRSLLPRVLVGIRNTLLLSSVAVLATAFVGVTLGLTSAYKGGAVDQVIVRLMDILFSFPALLLAILVSSVMGPGMPGAVVAIVVVTIPLMTRVVRASALSVAERDFVIAAEVSGARPTYLMVVHLLPNVAGQIAIQATYAVSLGILIESTISFLGLGVQPPSASLGSLMRESTEYLTLAPWLALGPGMILALTIASVNLVGDALRDVLDPREQRGLE